MSTSELKIGCAFLKHMGRLDSGGLASIGGGDTFAFSSMDTLRARGDLWVVSTPESQFLLADGLAYPFLRHSGFLPTPLTAIAEELGAPNASASPEVVRRVSEVLTRVLAMVSLMAPKAPSIMETAAQNLTAHLQSLVAPALRADELPSELQDALPGLFKTAVPIGSSAVGDIAIRIPANRLRLNKIVMLSAVPGGQWDQVDMGRFPSPAMALSYAIGNQQPVICQVTLKPSVSRNGAGRAGQAEGTPGGQIGDGSKLKAASPLARQLATGSTRWMALPEIIALSRMVDITPRRIYAARELVPAEASLAVPAPVFSPAAASSISAGLFAELYMHSVSQVAVIPHGTLGFTTPQTLSIRAAWLASVARSYMLQEAMALSDANFNVTFVGQSHLVVSISRRALKNLRKHIAASSLLSYPTGLRQLEEQAAPARETHMNQGAV